MTDLSDFVTVLAMEAKALEAGAAEARRQFGLAELSDEAVLGSTVYIWAAICAAQVDRRPQGQDAQRLDRNDESLVAKGDAP